MAGTRRWGSRHSSRCCPEQVNSALSSVVAGSVAGPPTAKEIDRLATAQLRTRTQSCVLCAGRPRKAPAASTGIVSAAAPFGLSLRVASHERMSMCGLGVGALVRMQARCLAAHTRARGAVMWRAFGVSRRYGAGAETDKLLERAGGCIWHSGMPRITLGFATGRLARRLPCWRRGVKMPWLAWALACGRLRGLQAWMPVRLRLPGGWECGRCGRRLGQRQARLGAAAEQALRSVLACLLALGQWGSQLHGACCAPTNPCARSALGARA